MTYKLRKGTRDNLSEGDQGKKQRKNLNLYARHVKWLEEQAESSSKIAREIFEEKLTSMEENIPETSLPVKFEESEEK